MPSKVIVQRQFKGMDAISLRQDIPHNLVRISDNLQIIGSPGVGGEWLSRPGYQGLLPTGNGGIESQANYALAQFVTATTATPPVYGTQLVYVSGGKVKMMANTVGATTTELLLTSFTYTDLVIQATNTQVTSVMRPFVASDVTLSLVVTGGTNFTVQTVTINSVSNGIATCSAALGTANATGGKGSVSNCSSNLSSANTFNYRQGKYIYWVDGQSGLFRSYIPGTNPTTAYTFAQINTFTVPNQPAKSSLTNVVSDAMVRTNWSTAPLLNTAWNIVKVAGGNSAGYSMITNNQFTGMSGSSADPPPSGWQTWGDTMDNGSGTGPYWDTGNGPEGIDWEVPNASYAAHAQFAHARVFYSTAHEAGLGTLHSAMIPESSGNFAYTDIVIGNPTTTTCTSAMRPFMPQDVGQTLNVTSGTGFTVQKVTITAVSSANVATVSNNLGTAGSTGGNATLDNGTQTYSDLQTNGATLYQVKSVANPFTSGAIGKTLTIISTNSNWTAGTYIISAYSNPWVTLSSGASNQNCATGSSTLGQATLGKVAAASTWGGSGVTLNRGALPPIDYVDSPGNAGLTANHVYSFTSMGTDPDFISFRMWNPPQAAGTTSRCDNAIMWPIDVGLKNDTSSPTSALHLQCNVDSIAPGFGYNCLGGSYVVRTFGSFLDLSTTNTISMSYSAPGTSPPTGIPFRFGIQQNGSTTVNWTLPVVYNANLSEFSADISVVATSVRASIQYLYLQVVADLPTTINPNDLCTLGSVTSGGNLTINGAPYNYVVTEIQDSAFTAGVSGNGVATTNTTDGLIETDPSIATSPDMPPTSITAEATMTVGTVLNTGTTNKIGLYRYGGVFPGIDPVGVPYYRQVAILPLWVGGGGGNPATGWTWSVANGTWTSTDKNVVWNPTTYVVTDNTPDSEIFLATILGTGRSALSGLTPNGVCDWQNRIVVWTGSQLNISWLVTIGNAAATYFNAINFPNDPYGTVKGIQVNVGGLDNDPIMSCAPMGSTLIIFKQRSVWQLAGTDATNFSLTQHLVKAGVGLVAPRAWCIHQNPMMPIMNVLWFLSADGVWEYDGGDMARPISYELEPLISPSLGSGGSNIGATLYKNACMVAHDRGAYLIIAVPQITYNDLVIQTTTTQVASLQRPFISTDVGKTLTITGGTGATVGALTISSVSTNGIATCSGSVGTAWSNFVTGVLSAGTANEVCYRYDMRYQGWTRYINTNFTGGSALSTTTDTNDLFFGGLDGQIYQLSGSGDAATPKAVTAATNATPIQITVATHGYSNGNIVRIAGAVGNTAANGQWTIANVTTNTFTLTNSVGNGAWSSGGTSALVSSVPFYLQSRGMGREGEGQDTLLINRPQWFSFDVRTLESVSATLNCWADESPVFSLAYTLPTYGVVRERVAADTRGNTVTLGISGTSYLPTRIREIGVECESGAPRRV